MTSRPAPVPGPIYALADWQALAPRPVPEAVAALAGAGISWIQIRAKSTPEHPVGDDDLFRAVEDSLELLERGGHDAVRLWIDDRADLAALLPVAGVHVGRRDLPPSAARRVVGGGVWIGHSTHDLQQLESAAADPDVDVVAVGPVYATSGKTDPDPVVGLELIRRARRLTGKPLVAIGGIDAERLPAVLEAGADSAAVLGAVCRGPDGDVADIAANARRLLKAVA